MKNQAMIISNSSEIHAFPFYKQNFYKQHPGAELLLLENFSHSSSTLSSKNNKMYSEKYPEEQVCLYSYN